MSEENVEIISFWQVWTMRDGKVIRATSHMDKAEAVKAAGLGE